jgi:hypothetical protein
MQSPLTPFRKKRRPAAKGPSRSPQRTSSGTAKRPAGKHRQAGAGVAHKAAPALRRSQSKTGSAWLAALDAANERFARVETLAGLLAACDDPGALSSELAARAGYFIEEDLRQVKKLLAEMGKGTR